LNLTEDDPRKLMPNSRVFHNHLIIDPAGALFDRGDPEYQPLRRVLVRRSTQRHQANPRPAPGMSERHGYEHVHKGRDLDLHRLPVLGRAG
jgi:hypothetical protein